jgi:sec-independent protein translocase protein TatA
VIHTRRLPVDHINYLKRSEHRMLGLDNPIHILFLLVIVLLVFGAKRLPEMGKSLGEGLRGFKDSVGGDPHISHMTSAEDTDAATELPAATPLPTETSRERTSERHDPTPVSPAA